MKNLTDKQLEAKIQTLQDKTRKLDVFRVYDGEDRVVLSTDAKNNLLLQPKTPTYFCGLSEIDVAVDGFKGGELVVVSGPTGQGKTTFLQTLTYTFKVKPLWFSYEVGLEDFLERFETLPVFALPQVTQPSNLLWLEQRIWEAKAKYDVKVVFVDHLHFLLSFDQLMNNSSLAIGHAMRELKRIAIETDTVIFLIAHLQKTRLEKAPTISDLRDSSFVGQEADMVFLVWREVKDIDSIEKYGKDSFLKIEKNRRKGTLCGFRMKHENKRFKVIAGGNYE